MKTRSLALILTSLTLLLAAPLASPSSAQGRWNGGGGGHFGGAPHGGFGGGQRGWAGPQAQRRFAAPPRAVYAPAPRQAYGPPRAYAPPPAYGGGPRYGASWGYGGGPGAGAYGRGGYGGGYGGGWRRGDFLPPAYRGFALQDYARFHLRRPPRGYYWCRSGEDFILVAAATGLIFEVVGADE